MNYTSRRVTAHSPSEGPSLEAAPLGFCHQFPALSGRQIKPTAFAPIRTQTVAVAVYSHPSQGRLDNPTPNDQEAPQLEQHRREKEMERKCFLS